MGRAGLYITTPAWDGVFAVMAPRIPAIVHGFMGRTKNAQPNIVESFLNRFGG